MLIKFEIDKERFDRCVTPCPNKIGGRSYRPVGVGSLYCVNCPHFGSRDMETMTVACNYPGGK